MGYSSRYHIASLTAVFVALAVGILIGSEIGGDVLNSTRENLERSLTEDLDRTRAQNEELRRQVGWARELGAAAIVPLVEDRLAGRRYALVGFGSLPEPVSDAVERILDQSGGTLVGVGVVREPPSTEALAGELEGTRYESLGETRGLLRDYGRTAGRQLVTGGRIFELSRPALMATSSGSFGSLNGVVLYRGPLPEGAPGGPARLGSRVLASSMTAGMASTGAALTGVEALDTEPSQVPFFESRRIPSVDSVDLESGQLALVYALGGAQGKFGVKSGADTFLPRPVGGLAAGAD
jgi:hypothetical protein